MNLSQFFYRLIKGAVPEYDDIAEYLNFQRASKTTGQMLRNKFNPNSRGHHANLDDAHDVLDMLDAWPALAEYAAAKCNRVLFELPKDCPDDVGFLDARLDADEKHGLVSRDFRQAYEDGVITEVEYQQVKRAVLAEVSSLMSFLANVERVKR